MTYKMKNILGRMGVNVWSNKNSVQRIKEVEQ